MSFGRSTSAKPALRHVANRCGARQQRRTTFLRTTATIDFLLSALRHAAAAKRLFRKALSDPCHPQPRVINTDQAPICGAAIPDRKKEPCAAAAGTDRCSI